MATTCHIHIVDFFCHVCHIQIWGNDTTWSVLRQDKHTPSWDAHMSTRFAAKREFSRQRTWEQRRVPSKNISASPIRLLWRTISGAAALIRQCDTHIEILAILPCKSLTMSRYNSFNFFYFHLTTVQRQLLEVAPDLCNVYPEEAFLLGPPLVGWLPSIQQSQGGYMPYRPWVSGCTTSTCRMLYCCSDNRSLSLRSCISSELPHAAFH